MEAVALGYKKGTLRLEAFGATVPVAIDDGVVYVPARYLAETILEASWPSQYRTLTNPDGRFQAVVREVPITTAAGQRMMLGLPVGDAGLWIAGINPTRVGEKVRDRLDDFVEALRAEAEHLLSRRRFQVVGGKTAPAKTQRKGRVVISGARRYEFACLECGAAHVLVEDVDNEMVYVILQEPRQ